MISIKEEDIKRLIIKNGIYKGNEVLFDRLIKLSSSGDVVSTSLLFEIIMIKIKLLKI